MMRTFLGAVLALLLAAGGLLAEEIKGKVKSVDAEKSTITVTVGDKDTTYNVAKFASIYTLGKGKKAQPMDITGGLKGVGEGADVTLTTEKKDDKDQVIKVQVDGAKKKKK